MAFAIVVEGVATRAHVDLVKQALMTLSAESMQQAGTIRYEFYQSQENPLKLFLFALWEDEAGWKANVASAAHDDYLNSLPDDAWEIRPVLTKLQPIDQ